jgi:hypothetical protein
MGQLNNHLYAKGLMAVHAASDPAERPVWPGTIGPSAGTPARHPGSARRTSTVDILFPEGLAAVVLRGRARDLFTSVDGTAQVIEEAQTDVRVGLPDRLVTRLNVEPDEWQAAMASLIGIPSGGRFRAALEECAPDLVASGSPLTLLLDEVPVTLLISGSSIARRGMLPAGAQQKRKVPLIDVCAGWAAGGVMVRAIERGDQPFLGEGPHAPSLDRPDDPLAWHATDTLPTGSMRRHRRLDLLPASRVDGPLTADVLFRDSFVEEDGQQSAVHEYGIRASVAADGTLLAIEATPHALPGPDCPNAAASAQRLVGMPLAQVRQHVRDQFSGTSTCTHLNDALRSLGDLDRLIPLLEVRDVDA